MTPEERPEITCHLAAGEELSPEWARVLFPPAKREYELVYHGKECEEDILAGTSNKGSQSTAIGARVSTPALADRNDKAKPGKTLQWKKAGVWYLAGSNTCIYSNPKEELGATQHNVQISNRRFRDDEFLIPRDLTEGRSAIRVRVNFTPVSVPLFPSHPVGELAWSEIRYTAYCFGLPQIKAASRSR